MVKYHLPILLACLMISGCSGLKEFEYHLSQTKRVKHAWKAAGPTGAGADYKDGWQTGYYDLSTGSDGQVPPVPPQKYWHSKYQNPAGQQSIADWYAGYQDGVIAAEHVGEAEWQLVPSSGVAALRSATIIDYPTYYNNAPVSEKELAEPLPHLPAAAFDRRQLEQTRQQPSQIAAAAQPELDLRTLSGRPSAPIVASPSGLPRALPAPPAPTRNYERVPQPTRQSPMVTDARENGLPLASRAPLITPRPAFSPQEHVASRAEQAELPRSEDLPALPRRHIEDVQPHVPAVTSDAPARRSTAIVVDQRQPPAAIVPDAPLPTQLYKEQSAMKLAMPAPIVSPAPLSVPMPNATTKPAEPTASEQQPANPIANIQTPEPAVQNPIVIHQFDTRDDSMLRAVKAKPEVEISKPATKIAQAPPVPEQVGNSTAEVRWAVPRKTESDVAAPPKAASTDEVAKATDNPGTPAITRPARTYGPVVVAAQPIVVPTHLAEHRANVPHQAAKPETAGPGKNLAPAKSAVAKSVLDQTASPRAAQTGADATPDSPATSQPEAGQPLIRMADTFPLDSSGTSSKPIVLLARPIPLSEASTTRR